MLKPNYQRPNEQQEKMPTKPFPLLPHLALAALLLPLWIFICYTIPVSMDDSAKNDFGLLGMFFVFFIPAAMLFAVLLSGVWRLAFAVTVGSIVVCCLLPDIMIHHDDDYMLEFSARTDTYPVGTEIFCNGVKMGEVPCKFTVRQLKETVPRWTTPPRQAQYFDDKKPLYTWIPWDGFLRERFDARQQAVVQNRTLEIDEQSEFWWSFRYKGATAFGRLNDWNFQNSNYKSFRLSSNYFSLIYPSAHTEYDLLLSILQEDSPSEGPLTPTSDWTAFVAENGRLLNNLFCRWEAIIKDRSIQPTLQAIACKRYGLSDVPTPEECEHAIKQMLHENSQCPVTSNNGAYVSGYPWNEMFGKNYTCNDTIMLQAIRKMGDACRMPLLRHYRNWKKRDFFESEQEENLLLVMLQEHPFPEFFDEMVRFYAQQYRGATTLMSFSDPRLLGLLKTMLQKKERFVQLESGIRSAFLVALNNPLLEPMIRDFIEKEISHINEDKVKVILMAFAQSRQNYDWVDQEELAQWIRSLDARTEIKSDALNLLNLSNKEKNTDLVHFFPEGTSAKVDGDEVRIGFSMTETEDLLKEHSDWPVERALETVLGNNASKINVVLAKQAVLTPALQEGKEIIVCKLWNDPTAPIQRERILLCVYSWYSTDYWSAQRDKLLHEMDNGMRWVKPVYLPGSVFSVRRHDYGFFIDQFEGKYQKASPDYLVDLFADLDTPEDCVYLPSVIRSSAKPEAKQLLEKWCQSENVALQQNAETALNLLEYDTKLRNEGRKRYNDLIAGRITPDEIMPPPPAWIWNGKEYVVEKNTEDK